jgi:hypothetical protein
MSFEWATGLFEGEGCLYKDKRSNGWTLQLRMTDRDVVQTFADVMNTGNKVHSEKTNSQLPHWKPVYRWTCSRKSEVTRILELMLPHLGQRRAYKALNCLDDYDL